MPALRFQILDSRLKLICLFLLTSVISHLISAPPALASTDPQSSTASATATVPSLTITGDFDAPTAPILVRPTDDSYTNDPRPEFVWKMSTDAGSNTLYYTLYLNGTATYLGISNLGNSSGNNFIARLDQTELKLIPSIPLPDGLYHWYVTATDLSGNTSRSTLWDLTIDTHSPPLTLTQLDIYSNPTLIEGSNFEIAGPKDVYFTLHSEPAIHIQITLTPTDGNPLTIFGITNPQGYTTLYQHLNLGVYTATILAFDPTGNTTFLPDFTLSITQASITLPGLPTLPIPPVVHDLPAALTHYPATISQVDTRSSLAVILLMLIALLAMLLLIILWRRRYNLLLVDSRLRPLSTATIYHSRPPHQSIICHLSYNQLGRLYVPCLTRHSTLTIRVVNHGVCTTHVLSISAPARRYTLVL